MLLSSLIRMDGDTSGEAPRLPDGGDSQEGHMELSEDQTYDRPQLYHQIQTGCSMQLQMKLSDNIHELTMQNIIERNGTQI